MSAAEEMVNEPAQPEKEPDENAQAEAPAEDGNAIPSWVVLPPDLKLPGAGRVVCFMRFREEWTDTPHKGERQCILWNLTDADERIAIKRISASGDSMGVAAELAKQSIRVIDGHATNWMAPRGPGSVDEFWSEIGAKCRQAIIRWYTQNHTLNEEETLDFFANCVATRTTG